MVKAVWKGVVIAESKKTVEVEGNEYFPPKSVKKKYLKKSDFKTVCHWKGEALYYDVVVDGEVNENAAWYYPSPKPGANKIKDYIAFWQGVEIS